MEECLENQRTVASLQSRCYGYDTFASLLKVGLSEESLKKYIESIDVVAAINSQNRLQIAKLGIDEDKKVLVDIFFPGKVVILKHCVCVCRTHH